jgi:hypothetical protein
MPTPKISINAELDALEVGIDAFLKAVANKDKDRGQTHAKDNVERVERLRDALGDDINAERILFNTLLDRLFYAVELARRASYYDYLADFTATNR